MKTDENSSKGTTDAPEGADDLTGNMPEPDRNPTGLGTDDEPGEKTDQTGAENEKKAVEDQLTDRHGKPFHPMVHQTTEDGEPSTNKNGNLRRKPGMAPKGGVDPYDNIAETATEGEDTGPSDHKVCAVTSAGGVGMALKFVFEEFEFKDENLLTGEPERDMLINSFEQYYKIRGVSDIPSEMMIAQTMVALIWPRVGKVPISKRFRIWWAGIKEYAAALVDQYRPW